MLLLLSLINFDDYSDVLQTINAKYRAQAILPFKFVEYAKCIMKI